MTSNQTPETSIDNRWFLCDKHRRKNEIKTILMLFLVDVYVLFFFFAFAIALSRWQLERTHTLIREIGIRWNHSARIFQLKQSICCQWLWCNFEASPAPMGRCAHQFHRKFFHRLAYYLWSTALNTKTPQPFAKRVSTIARKIAFSPFAWIANAAVVVDLVMMMGSVVWNHLITRLNKKHKLHTNLSN